MNQTKYIFPSSIHESINHLSQLGLFLFFQLILIDLHLPFKDHRGFFLGPHEHPHKGIQILLRMLRHDTHPQPRLSNLDHRELDPIDMHAHIHHQPGHQATNDLIADEHWEDGALVAEHFDAPLVEFPSQVVVVLEHFDPELAAGL